LSRRASRGHMSTRLNSTREIAGGPLAHARTRTMSNNEPTQELEGTSVARSPGNRARTLAAVAAAALLLLLAVGGFAWYVQAGRVSEAERALATVTAERDAAVTAAAQGQTRLDQVEAERDGVEARRLELEQQLQAARDELARLRTELASAQAAVAAGREGPTPLQTPLPSEAVARTPEPGTPPAVEQPASPPSAAEQPPTPAAAEPVPAGKPQLAVEPAAGASVENLTITFDVNSSYLPANLDGRLRQLASRLERGKAYRVELIGSVGADPVANASEQEAARYNRWIAERRVSRVAEFLQKNAEPGVLTIKQDFAANDSSRRVVVRVRPVP